MQVGNHCGGCIGRIEEILEKQRTSSFLWSLRTL
ncbi:MAG: hypothetical protein ACXV8O_09880 [Methylobacter sp.]